MSKLGNEHIEALGPLQPVRRVIAVLRVVAFVDMPIGSAIFVRLATVIITEQNNPLGTLVLGEADGAITRGAAGIDRRWLIRQLGWTEPAKEMQALRHLRRRQLPSLGNGPPDRKTGAIEPIPPSHEIGSIEAEADVRPRALEQHGLYRHCIAVALEHAEIDALERWSRPDEHSRSIRPVRLTNRCKLGDYQATGAPGAP